MIYNFKYSIIVPLYNAERYVQRTLDGLKKIENKYTEIIFVNDGCSDKTFDIVEKCNIKNSFIINKINGGVSSARNEGLRNSRGKYVLFLDGDDWLDKNIFEYIDQYYNYNYDLIKFGFIFVEKSKKTKYEIVNKDMIVQDNEIQKLINGLLSTSKYNSASNQFIKRKILCSNNIFFKEKVKFAEDFDFNLRLFKKIKRSIILKKCMYYYYQNLNGTSKSPSKINILKCLDDAIKIYIPSRNLYKTESDNIEYIDVLDRIFNEIINIYKRVFYIDDINLREIRNIAKTIYTNDNYLILKKELIKYGFKPKTYFKKLFFYEKINLVDWIIYIIFKIVIKKNNIIKFGGKK